MKKVLISILLLAFAPLLFGQSQIEFVAQVTEVNVDPENPALGTLKVALILEADLQILVDETTEIEDEDGDPISLSEILVGSFVKVEGIFTPEGILALEIKLGGEAKDFEVKGQIDKIDTDNREITVANIVILVPAEAEIKDASGAPLLFADLEVGQFVKVEGTFADEQFVATEVKVIPAEAAVARVKVEGLVSAMEDDSIKVTVEAVGPVLIQVTPDTDIRGDLAVGKYVRVIGKLDTDLSVIARKITVIPLLRLSPRQLKMGTEETRTVHAILRVLQETDIELTLSSLDPAVADTVGTTVTIPAGTLNAMFEVQSGAAAGETEIVVGLPTELGGGEESLEVEVKERHDGGTEEKTAIQWNPRKLNMGTESLKRAVVQSRKPAEADVPVELVLVEGAADLVSFPSQVIIPAGEKRAAVEFLSGLNTGEAKIEAILPMDLGGDSDEIEIEVRGRKDKSNHSLEWDPEELETTTNQTAFAKLVLGEPAPTDLKVTLTATPRSHSLTFPAEVVIPAGADEVEVEIQTGDKKGKMKIRASLTFRKGGKQATLEIEIED